MSWDRQTYSFGTSNAQPPTPTRTPIVGSFPSPNLLTPRPKYAGGDQSGWTPVFAEEYSVFNQTPGRLTTPQFHPFLDHSTPRHPYSAGQLSPVSGPEYPSSQSPSHASLTPAPTAASLPPVDRSQQLSSSVASPTHGRNLKCSNLTTPVQTSGRYFDTFFSGQTATPPGTASKESERRLAPKFDTGSMQRYQELFDPATGMPRNNDALGFASPVPADMFAYTLSGPATAPAFSHSRPFWDPDSAMGGMDVDFNVGDSSIFGTPAMHRMGDSFDWNKSPQVLEQIPVSPIFNQQAQHADKRQLPLLSRPPVQQNIPAASGLSFDLGMATISDDPFAMVASTGAVNPGLLFSVPDVSSSLDVARPRSSASTKSQSASKQASRQPYQHQQRELKRDEEELRRSRSSREIAEPPRFDRAAFSSPGKASRPGLRRTVSDSRARKTQTKPAPLNIAASKNTASLPRTGSRGRLSPLKHMSSSNLASIPEMAASRVTFTIDANGRARTDVVVDEQRTTPGGPRRSPSVQSSSPSASSSDDEPIMIPSRDKSSSRPVSRNRPSSSNSQRLPDNSGRRGSAQQRLALSDEDSEAETEVEDDGTGDAANALRKTIESRRQSNGANGRAGGQIGRNSRPLFGQITSPQYRQPYLNHSYSTTSPTTMTDLGTPSTDRGGAISDSTRCVCGTLDGGFMIQCESCEKWLHANCVRIDPNDLPQVYICAFCAQTPNMRGGRIRDQARGDGHVAGSSPLAHKSFAPRS